ncbi:hypothetical protein RBSH_05677 [Rhodopirellula baltica SH28]|uniref:Uncharacterized protein n=1 Tax=Rhodopirellula baltica SH28 TaxID=993517 RepID=K5D975_RHOBT|nr:hypothetical protein RBSH_05677 [Rhodopirellula baltica SH28]
MAFSDPDGDRFSVQHRNFAHFLSASQLWICKTMSWIGQKMGPGSNGVQITIRLAWMA